MIESLLATTPSKRPVVLLRSSAMTAVRIAAKRQAPSEICGVVRAVVQNEGIEIRSLALAPNCARDTVWGFRLRRKDAEARKNTWLTEHGRLSGIFHSHTKRSAQPSRLDMVTMRRWPGIHLIAALDGPFRVFLSHDRIVEADIRVI
ncbi:Mov34/MPN/PAD-1 family protein [Candidatus Entotheonella palauensis]|uniref:Mov34/MPN/PAD-1 family protein n=1 Tax=Candidatus Entotheonella palauensis TaxID=93172 RepID=UPI0015C4A46D|nr:Mov34/MPN/PAD-1 family protein [Candidatus Entotheonella palauensis]